MENKKLTLENYDEIALELLKKENGDSDEIKYYWNYNDEILAEEMEKIRELKGEIGTDYLTDALEHYLREVNFDYETEQIDEIVNKVLENYVYYPAKSEEYKNFRNNLTETLQNNFSVNTNINTLLENTKINDFIISICPSEQEKGNDTFQIGDFKDPELLRDELEKEFNPVVFLIQSQGYELEDLYNDEKVEKSPFLKSLKNEFDNYGDSVNMSIGFNSPRIDLKELIELEELGNSIIIPKGVNTDIVLEKDIVLKKENVKFLSEYCEEQENEYTYIIGGTIEEKAKITDETAFKMHEINIDKVCANLQFKLDKEEHEEVMREIERKNKLHTVSSLGDFKLAIQKMQGEVLTFLEENNYLEKQGENYVFKNEVLDKENFEKIGNDYISKNLDFKNSIFLENFSLEELVERFELETPDFEIYSKDGELLYNSFTKEKSDKLETIIKEARGEEFWNDMNLSEAKSWESLLDESFVEIVSKNTKENYDNYTDFISEEMVGEKLDNEIFNENMLYIEDLRLNLIANSEYNVISKEKLDNLKEKYIGKDFKSEYEDEIKGIVKNDKEIDI